MLESNMNNMPSQNDDRDSSVGEYLSRAAAAVAQGNQMLALHLYLAAFERAARWRTIPCPRRPPSTG